MTPQEYEMFYRKVARLLERAGDEWFAVGWAQMHTVCDAKVVAGTLEKRWNGGSGRIEYRALCDLDAPVAPLAQITKETDK